jgi:hypothetical protein
MVPRGSPSVSSANGTRRSRGAPRGGSRASAGRNTGRSPCAAAPRRCGRSTGRSRTASPAPAAVDLDVLLEQVPAARPHEQRRDLSFRRYSLALGRGEADGPGDGVAQVDLALDEVVPGRGHRVLEVRHEDPRAGVQGVDDHLAVDRPGDLDAAVRRSAGISPTASRRRGSPPSRAGSRASCRVDLGLARPCGARAAHRPGPKRAPARQRIPWPPARGWPRNPREWGRESGIQRPCGCLSWLAFTFRGRACALRATVRTPHPETARHSAGEQIFLHCVILVRGGGHCKKTLRQGGLAKPRLPGSVRERPCARCARTPAGRDRCRGSGRPSPRRSTARAKACSASSRRPWRRRMRPWAA